MQGALIIGGTAKELFWAVINTWEGTGNYMYMNGTEITNQLVQCTFCRKLVILPINYTDLMIN